MSKSQLLKHAVCFLVIAVATHVIGSSAFAGTVGYWRFEGASTSTGGANNDWLDDYSGNGHDLSAFNGAAQGAIPGSGPGADFSNPVPLTGDSNLNLAVLDGINDRVGLADDPAFTSNTLTLEAFFNFDAVLSSHSQIIAGHFDSTERVTQNACLAAAVTCRDAVSVNTSYTVVNLIIWRNLLCCTQEL